MIKKDKMKESIMDLKKDTQLLKKQLKTYFIVGFVLLIGFCFLLFFSISRVHSYVPDMDRHTDRDVKFHIDEIAIHRSAGVGHLSIQGWSFIPEENLLINNTCILLRNRITGEYLKLPTMVMLRPDITEEFNEDELEPLFIYNHSGWHSRVFLNQLSGTIEDYEIVILYQGNRNYVVVNTNVFLEGR
jgi:hypothetical protein